MLTQGEGSRGGKIIGHTRGGLPIYASSQREKHSIGKAGIAGYIGAGVAVGAATGAVGGHSVRKGGAYSHFANEYARKYKEGVKAGEKVGPLFSQGRNLNNLKKTSEDFARQAQNSVKAGFRLKTLGSVIAGTLIGIGVNEALKDREELKNNKKAQALLVAAPAVAGAIATGTGFYKKAGGKKRTILKAAKFAIKNLLLFK